MKDLDTELRELLQRKASQMGGTAPSAPPAVLRRARRRRGFVGAMALVTVVAIGAGAYAGVRWLGRPTDTAPADTTVDTLGGVTIEYPQDWFLGSPEDVGLQGEDILLILSNQRPEPGPASCTALATGEPGQVLMTVVDRPLAEPGSPGARPWPVELEQPAGSPDRIEGCPGWVFHRTSWTAEGRSFEATAGFSADATEVDRAALLTAFASMTFEPLAGGTDEVVLVSGQTGDEAWTLSVSAGAAGQLSFTVDREDVVTGEGSSSGTGTGGVGETGPITAFIDHFGEGAKVTTLVYGAVTTDAASVDISLTGEDARGNPSERGPEPAEMVDLPPAFGDVHAFYFVAGDPWTGGTAEAFDTEGTSLGAVPLGDEPEPASTGPGGVEGLPEVLPVAPQEHELYWAAYLSTVNSSTDRASADETTAWLQDHDLESASGEISCDQPTGGGTIGDPGDDRAVAVYFTSEEDAQAFVAWYLQERFPGADPVPVQVLEIGRYCGGTPPAMPLQPTHGGTYWGAYLWVGNFQTNGEHASSFSDPLRELGVPFSEGDLSCDDPVSGEPIGEPGEDWRVAVYLESEADANTFVDWFSETYFPGARLVPIPIVEVRTMCLD